MTIATTILEQLGGTGRLGLMLNAKGFVATQDGVTFRIGRNDHGIKRLSVELQPNDLYRIKFWLSDSCYSHVSNVNVAQLAATIEQETGLYLSLGTMKG